MTKIFKTIFIISLGILIALVGIFFIQLTPAPITTQKQPAQQKPLPAFPMPTLTYQKDVSKDATYQINVIRPNGFPPAIQTKIDAFYDNAKTALLTEAQNIRPATQGQQQQVYTLTSPQPLVTSYGPYVFLISAFDIFTGGVHNTLQYFQIAYDVRTRQEITLAQFFTDPATAYGTIANAIIQPALQTIGKKIFTGRDVASITEEEKKQVAATAIQGLQPNADNYKYWFIDKDGNLGFVFPPYQIAPWELGQQVVGIPLSTVKDKLNLQMFIFN